MPIGEGQEFFIQWHLTERCNLSCSHCYQEGGASDELSLEEARALVHEAADLISSWSGDYGIGFSPSFTVTGGEPFFRPDLFPILEEIAGTGFAIYLLTNGTVITAERAQRLAEIGVKGVQVSMEGPEPVHEAIRGKGSFGLALRGVRNLIDAGLTVTLNTTLSELNAGSFREMIEIASAEGVQKLGFSRLVPSGRGAGLLSRALPAERVKTLYEEIFSLQTGGLSLVTGDPVASQMRSPSTDPGCLVPTGGCAAGVSGLTIHADGTVSPCRRMPIPLGNVRTDSLRDIWACSPVLEALRDRSRYSGRCGSCPRWSQCRGCRAIAYANSLSRGGKDFLSEDPQCLIEP